MVAPSQARSFFSHTFAIFFLLEIYLLSAGSLRYDDGNGKQNGKKSNRLRLAKQLITQLHVQHAFLYISLPSLLDYDVKLPHFTFYGGPEHCTTIFFFFF